jgi:sucrose-phosphate synthase
VFGEVLFDHFEDGTKALGGAPFNVAWHLRGLGADPVLISAVGADVEGLEVLARMEGWGLTTEGVAIDEAHPTGRVTVEAHDAGHSFRIGPDQAWDFIELVGTSGDEREAGGLLYHGTLALRSDASWASLRRLVGRGTPTFVDVNLRPPWVDPERVRWCMQTARWLKLNEHELAEITGLATDGATACADAAAWLAHEHTVPTLIVTRGAAGALLAAEGEEVLHVPAPAVHEVVDSVGAGDAFSAVVCLGILFGWPVRLALERAARFAADICRIRGATTSDPALFERHLKAWTLRPMRPGDRPEGLHVISLSVHGLVRGYDIELGRDADTGGQVSYAVDEARALAEHPEVARVDLVTRLVQDRRIGASYAVPFEPLSDRAQIVRLPFGPKRYLRKESLWPHLDSLLDELLRYVRSLRTVPDLIHGHYADAGYVGAQLAKLLGVPFFFTGHSLGRVKRARLIEAGKDRATLEERYRLSRRIEAEERALETAAVVVASTRQEVRDQYELYDHYEPDDMRVIPPGVDLSRFGPSGEPWTEPPIARTLERFLRDPTRPMVLAVARPDERKNFGGLLEAFGTSGTLRREANLVLVAGSRDDIRDLPANARGVLNEVLLLIDKYDLYGSVAYPKTHHSEDIPALFQLAARTRGVFVNPAYTEPFGLTLLEAAASGLPVVSTDDGGPRDILSACGNGILVEATEAADIRRGLEEALSSRGRWDRWSRNGIANVHEQFSWHRHAERYVGELQRVSGGLRPGRATGTSSRLPLIDRIVVTDVDDTLTGDREAVKALFGRLAEADVRVGFGIATGRRLDAALEVMDELGVPIPDVLITGSGTQLHYGDQLIRDRSWERQIHHRWDRARVVEALRNVEGLRPDEEEVQTSHRLRYVREADRGPSLAAIRKHLRTSGLRVTAILDHGRHVDVIPIRASPGLAIRFLSFKWDLPPDHLLVCGDSGNDADMLAGETLGVVVGNHTQELDFLRGRERVHYARRSHAWGILEGIDWYDFLGAINPDPEPIE